MVRIDRSLPVRKRWGIHCYRGHRGDIPASDPTYGAALTSLPNRIRISNEIQLTVRMSCQNKMLFNTFCLCFYLQASRHSFRIKKSEWFHHAMLRPRPESASSQTQFEELKTPVPLSIQCDFSEHFFRWIHFQLSIYDVITNSLGKIERKQLGISSLRKSNQSVLIMRQICNVASATQLSCDFFSGL